MDLKRSMGRQQTVYQTQVDNHRNRDLFYNSESIAFLASSWREMG